MASEPMQPAQTTTSAAGINSGGPSPALISFGAVAILSFALMPVFGLIYIYFISDSFLDLDVSRSDLYQFVFNSIGSPSQWISFFQRYLTPAIGALIPILMIGRKGEAAFSIGAIFILVFALCGFFAVFLLNGQLDTVANRLFIENAYSLPSANAAQRDLFDAKIAASHVYFERLQDSMLFIVATICGIQFAKQ
jgi:hypothetical protein